MHLFSPARLFYLVRCTRSITEVDCSTREALAIEVEMLLPSARVVRVPGVVPPARPAEDHPDGQRPGPGQLSAGHAGVRAQSDTTLSWIRRNGCRSRSLSRWAG